MTLLFAGVGLLLVALGFPLAEGRVPPNRWYGMRFPSTLSNEQAWYEVNMRSGRDMLMLGLVVFGLAVTLPIVVPGWRPEWRALAIAAILVGGLMRGTARATRHAGQLRKDGDG